MQNETKRRKTNQEIKTKRLIISGHQILQERKNCTKKKKKICWQVKNRQQPKNKRQCETKDNTDKRSFQENIPKKNSKFKKRTLTKKKKKKPKKQEK